MEYRIDKRMWTEERFPVKIAGQTFPGADPATFSPEHHQRIGEIRTWTKRGKARTSCVVINGKHYPLFSPVPHGRFFRRRAGWVRATDVPGTTTGFVQVVRLRKSAVASAVLALFALVLAFFSMGSGVSPTNMPSYLADQAGIVKSNAEASATITYAAYESTPDQSWKAGETHQATRLALPASVTSTDSEGNETTSENPVIAAPRIYVDLDGDGAFSEEECVFNPITYAEDGSVADRGEFLRAGNEVDEIDLTRPLDAGTYAARTSWTPLSAEDGSECNPMSFDWNLIVE